MYIEKVETCYIINVDVLVDVLVHELPPTSTNGDIVDLERRVLASNNNINIVILVKL